MAAGKKFDEGKIRYDLIPPEAKRALASQLAYGANKYGDRNWEQGLHFGRLVRAAEGHLTDWWAGEDFDEEGRPHLYGALTSLAMLLSLVSRFSGTEFDNRPVKVSPAEVEVPLPYHPAGHAVITYDPVEFAAGFNGITHIPPVDSSVNSEIEPKCERCNRLIDVGRGCTCKPEETTNPTGESRYKVHMLTNDRGSILCNTKNSKEVTYYIECVTCKLCLASKNI